MPAPAVPTRRERTHRIRRLAVTWTVTAFVAAWGGLFVQMRAGADPVLGSGTAAAVTTTSTTTTQDDTSTSSSEDTGVGTSVTEQQTDTPSAVTTSQS